jgi:hypothetical protein
MRTASTLALLGLTCWWSSTVTAQNLQLVPGVREIEADTLADLAVARVDQPIPVIYYNPRLFRRYGPLLGRFFLAHEYGHIARHHTRAGLADLPEAVRDSVLRNQELEADCFAASQPGPQDREAAEAAIRFFTRLGPFRFDVEHPTGSQRTAQILSCMPEPPEAGGLRLGETGVEVGPVSGEPQPIRFRVDPPVLGGATHGAQAVLWIDGRRLGTLSNMRLAEPLTVELSPAGIHNYRITMDVYALDEALQFNPDGSVSGQGQVMVQNGDRFLVEWQPGGTPRLVREAIR